MAGGGLVILIAILTITLQRTVLGVGVESDFTGVFALEAQRILQGEPLQLPYHPPGYAFVIALGRVLGGEWLDTGLWISGIAAAVFMAASLTIVRRLAGTTATWGALLAFACSTPFLAYASVASSDMMFAAMVYVLLALVVHALAAPNRTMLWAGCGTVAAFVLLTRTNGVAAAAVLLLPFLVPSHVASRLRNLATVASGFCLPLLAWIAYATHTGSPLHPVHSYLNIAVLAYGNESGKWLEQKTEIQQYMHSMADVLAYDPVRLVRNATAHLALLPIKAARSLTWLPLALMAVPGLALMLLRHRTPALLACLFILGGITAVAGIPEYISRFHLILVPLIGALAGVTCAWALDRFRAGPAASGLLAAASLVAAGIVGASAYARVLPQVERPVQHEFAEAIPYILRLTARDATLVARNPNLPFETGRQARYLPDVRSAPELYQALCQDLDHARPAYLFVGEKERLYRSALVEALSAQPVAWLEPVANGSTTQWTLHRIRFELAGDGPVDEHCSSEAAAPGLD